MKEKNLAVTLALALALTLTVLPAQPLLAADASLLPASAGDLTPQRLVPTPAAGMPVPQETVRFSWPLEADKALDLDPQPAVSRSKEYHLDVTAAELRAGVPVPTVSAGALVRLNPLGDADWAAQVAIDPAGLEIVTPGGDTLRGPGAMELLVSAEQMQAAATPFPAGTSAFRLRAELGAGTFVLRAPELAAAERYALHVLEPSSDVVLEVAAGRDAYLHGQTLTVATSVTDGRTTLALGSVRGVVTSPGGRSWEVTFQGARGGYQATLPLDAMEGFVPGLWEAHVAIEGSYQGLTLRRGAKTAFAVAVPTARLAGGATVRWNDAGTVLKADVTVEVAQAGRYDVRGVLYGTDAAGQLQPMGIAQTASYLEPGSQSLKLRFDEKIFAGSKLVAPYRVRDLRLMDQGRMGLVHRQAEGFDVR